MWPILLFFLKNLLLCIIGTLSSLPGKFKYSLMNNFLSWWNYSQLRFNWTKEHYIYIYSHPQTDCFVPSELFSVARHAERSKPESKPVQFYDGLSFRPLGRQRTTLAAGIFRYFIFFSNQQQQPLFTFFHTL